MPKSSIQIVPTADWPRVIAALAHAAEDFGDEVTKAADERMQKAADEARAKVLSVPSRGTSNRHARTTIAQALKVVSGEGSAGLGGGKEITVDVEVVGLPYDYEPLPRSFDKPTFRHPVYGGPAWVSQRGNPWFASTLYKAGDALEQDIEKVIENTARLVAAAG